MFLCISKPHFNFFFLCYLGLPQTPCLEQSSCLCSSRNSDFSAHHCISVVLLVCVRVCVCFETESNYVVATGLKLAVWARLALDSEICLPSACYLCKKIWKKKKRDDVISVKKFEVLNCIILLDRWEFSLLLLKLKNRLYRQLFWSKKSYIYISILCLTVQVCN